MLVIRLQRTGRKGHAQFRIVIQDSRRTPSSGKIVAQLGVYNPHTKQTKLDKEKAQFYLDHGAQPSDRVVRLLKAEKVKLPAWVKEATPAKRETRNPEKRRSTAPPAPAEPTEDVPAAEPVAEADDAQKEQPAEEVVTPEETAEPSAEEAADATTPEAA